MNGSPPEPEQEESTGLPGLRRWRTVYGLVLGALVLWVGLLTWLTQHYR